MFAVSLGCVAFAAAADSVASTVVAGRNAPAVIERVTLIANNNVNPSHMMVCFIAASPRPIEKSAVSPKSGIDGAQQL